MIRGLQVHPGGRLRLGALQAQGPRGEPRRVRAPHRGVPRARHRLLLLQRRQRLDGHRAQGVAARRVARLSDHLRRRAQDRRQRPAAHRLLPGLRLGRQVRRRLDARGGARRRLHGAHLDERVRARGDGAARRLDRGRRRASPARARRAAAHHPVAGSAVRAGEVPRAREAVRHRLRLLRDRGLGGRGVRRTASSWPTPAPRMPSATRSSAASPRWSPTWCARRTATNTTGRWPTTCSVPPATSPPRSTSSRPTRSARPPSSSAIRASTPSCRPSCASPPGPTAGASATCRWPRWPTRKRSSRPTYIRADGFGITRGLPALPGAAHRRRGLPALQATACRTTCTSEGAAVRRKLQDRLQGLRVMLRRS